MSYRLILRPEAEADLAQQFDYYNSRKKGLGNDFLREVSKIFRQIEQTPLRNAPIYRNARRALVRRYPFKVFYMFENETVEVIGVIHFRRDQPTWQQRVS